METIKIKKINNKLNTENIYELIPLKFSTKKYLNRVSRNIGWISKEEQIILRKTTVGIAGCGGMGGLIALTLLRLGVGTIKIADNDFFEESNLNRQVAANRRTIGKSKAIETAIQMRKISEDSNIHIYPMGITNKTVGNFASGCDFVFDEIEFWAIGSRLILHNECNKKKIDFFNCNTVGFQTSLFYFNPFSKKLSEYIGIDEFEGMVLERDLVKSNLDLNGRQKIFNAITKAFVPNIPTYGKFKNGVSIESFVIENLLATNSASILSTNPVFSCGVACNFFLILILRYSGSDRKVEYPPLFPSYISIDSVKLFSKLIKR